MVSQETKAYLRQKYNGALDTEQQKKYYQALKNLTQNGGFVTKGILKTYVNAKEKPDHPLMYWREIKAPPGFEYITTGSLPMYAYFYQDKSDIHDYAITRPIDGSKSTEVISKIRGNRSMRKMKESARQRVKTD